MKNSKQTRQLKTSLETNFETSFEKVSEKSTTADKKRSKDLAEFEVMVDKLLEVVCSKVVISK